jgi:hypothetical protein
VVAERSGGGRPLAAVRRAAFVPEQRVPRAPERGAVAGGAVRLPTLAKREPVGTGRLPAAGKIGRPAAVPSAGRHGVGSLLLRRPVELARARGQGAVCLRAQA